MIKLVSINIERSKHFDLVVPFIRREAPDVLCIQELLQRDALVLADAYGSEPLEYAPMTRHQDEEGKPVTGVAVFSKLTVVSHDAVYYVGTRDVIPEHGETPDRGARMNCAVALADIEKDGAVFRVGTTHFTWSERGLPDDTQRRSVRALIRVLEGLGEFVLCGDFNAPRGGEIFSVLAERYQDNIPPQYGTSIDLDLHRAGHLPAEKMDEKMVDGLFSTPAYVASGVRFEFGLSDHAGIIATIERAERA